MTKQDAVDLDPIMAAFRDRFSYYDAEFNTFSPFSFFEAGYLAAKHAEHVSVKSSIPGPSECQLCHPKENNG